MDESSTTTASTVYTEDPSEQETQERVTSLLSPKTILSSPTAQTEKKMEKKKVAIYAVLIFCLLGTESSAGKFEVPLNSTGKFEVNSTDTRKSESSPLANTTTHHDGTSLTNRTAPETGMSLTNSTAQKNGTLLTNSSPTKEWWEKLIQEPGIAFAAGAGLSAIICTSCFFVIGCCLRRKRRKRKYSEQTGTALVAVASKNQQDERTALQAVEKQGTVGMNRDVDYATIDVSQLKKKKATEEQERNAETDYAEIRKERNSWNNRAEEGDEAAGEEGGTEHFGAEIQECSEAGEAESP
ncbi:hypothetical protein GJAV_G00004470 [Gymnothorax javanicus]|nr:hypothetical protein GJAV_G00004470 [Gymnothorax javanicus]